MLSLLRSAVSCGLFPRHICSKRRKSYARTSGTDPPALPSELCAAWRRRIDKTLFLQVFLITRRMQQRSQLIYHHVPSHSPFSPFSLGGSTGPNGGSRSLREAVLLRFASESIVDSAPLPSSATLRWALPRLADAAPLGTKD